jgi:hypothetical protein
VPSDGQLTTADGPGGPTFTDVAGANSRGEMGGRYTLVGVNHAYLLSAGQLTTIDYPGATFTGVKPEWRHGGRYRDANVVHGFMLMGFRLVRVSSGS